MRVRYFILLGTASAILFGCSSLKQDRTIGWSANQLYEAAKAEREGGSYTAAVDYYDKLLARFPYGSLAQQSILDIAYVHYKNSEPDKAIEKLNEFLHTYPQHPYADYALFLRGVVEYERNVSFFDRLMPTNLSQTDPEALKTAFNTFAEVADKYPQSEYAEDARARMVFIHNLLGEHTLEVANYYLRRGTYIAAINRYKQVLEEYEQSQSAPYALAAMSRAYREIGETALAQDAEAVLRLNFADKLQDKEIRHYLNGDIHKQPSFWQRINAKPKI